MAKSISYSDFLKEGALQEQVVKMPIQSEHEFKPFRIVPEDISSDIESKAFWKRLRHFYRTGERPEGKNGVFVPALIAPYLQQGNWEIEFPFYLAQESSTSQSLEKLVYGTCDNLFKEGDAKVLKRFLPKLIQYFKISSKNSEVEFKKAKDIAINKLLQLEVHDEDGERFKVDVDLLAKALPDEGHILSFHHEVPLLLIRQKLEQIEWNRNSFKTKIKEKRDDLLNLLNLNAEKSGKEEPDKGFEFASDMIALDKVQDMQPVNGSSNIDDKRIARIQGIITELNNALEQKENSAHIFINESLKNEYSWEKIFAASAVSFVKLSEAFQKVQQLFDKNIKLFTSVLINMRKADLELEGKYEVDIHDDYFNHFKWFKLNEVELNIFPPVVLFTRSNDLLEDGMAMFSKLMTSNKPINVVALKDRTVNPTDPNIDWEDASLSFRQELVSNALSLRNVHTLQCATDRPEGLLNGIRAGLNSVAPSLMHILVPSPEDEAIISFLKINAAAAGRYFPYLMYDPHKGLKWGSRFDVLDNSQAENDWPIYPFTYMTAAENENILNLAFTYADYKAMNKSKVEELFMVPESMVSDYLVPLQDFLQLNQNEQTGKVPFIWLIDEDNCMVRAALPYMWVESCQERLDFWNFIQELGGLNNYHVKISMAKAKEEWDKSKEEEIASLKAQFEEDLAKSNRESAGVAMEKLASILLDLDDITPVPKAQSAKIKVSENNVEEVLEEEQQEEIQEEEQEEQEETEAWIETFRCTSCNDCTDRYPAIFDYNEDKQAFVKDASKGTFEQIVLAAENCPASCIHPGAPLNSNEDNLEELIERAAKLN